MRLKVQSIALAVSVLALAQGFLGTGVLRPQWKRDFAPKTSGIAEGLSPDQLLAALAGFREMIAGILWVRADSFFDNGNYDAILPIIRLVTFLDPKQIDVYATGMWHIAYNFTDEEQRSDRRYIPSALALGREGSEKNPETYELFFETGWIWYHKIQDNHPKAVQWFEDAAKRPDILPARKNLLSMVYQRNGQPDKALELLYDQYDKALEASKDPNAPYGSFQQRDTVENNIDTTLVRMAQRGWFGKQLGEKGAIPYDTDNPFDVGFSVRCTVIEPRVLQFEGTWNVRPVGTRVWVTLRDEDYPRAIPAGQDWDAISTVNLDPPKDLTYMMEQLYVKNRRFDKKVDMSKDPTMYPIDSKKQYVLEFFYNPRVAPPHIQDKFGWSGEGMTDKNFLNTEIRPGIRVMYTSMKVSGEQLLRRGEFTVDGKTPVLQTSNYKSPDRSALDKDLIEVPGILNEGQKPATPPPVGAPTKKGVAIAPPAAKS